jgi:hypothetical protein
MDDILLLPEDLRRKSLSEREIVLIYDDALQALDILESAGWAILGWEPWLKLPSGAHVHPTMGGDFHQEATEDWTTYVHRSIQLCRRVMKEEQQRWDQGTFWSQEPLGPGSEKTMVLYFCLTADNNE